MPKLNCRRTLLVKERTVKHFNARTGKFETVIASAVSDVQPVQESIRMIFNPVTRKLVRANINADSNVQQPVVYPDPEVCVSNDTQDKCGRLNSPNTLLVKERTVKHFNPRTRKFETVTVPAVSDVQPVQERIRRIFNPVTRKLTRVYAGSKVQQPVVCPDPEVCVSNDTQDKCESGARPYSTVTVQQKQQVRDTPTVQQNQQVQDTPTVQQNQQVRDTPTVQQNQQVQDTPTVQQNQQVQDTATVQQKTQVQDTTTSQQTQQVQDTNFAASSQRPTVCIDVFEFSAEGTMPSSKTTKRARPKRVEKVINPLTGRSVTVKENKRRKQDTDVVAPSQQPILTPQVQDTDVAAPSQQPILTPQVQDTDVAAPSQQPILTPQVQDTDVAAPSQQLILTPHVQDTVFAAPSQQLIPTTLCIDAFESIVIENGARPDVKKEVKCSDKWEKTCQELLIVHTELCTVPDQRQCICCGFNLPTVRCLDCGSHVLFCEEDFVEHHKNAAFHSPEIWNGHCFVPYAANLPVLVHNNHKVPNCAKHTKEITVIGMRGHPQLFTFEFCTCESDNVTLLRHRLWASSPEMPSLALKLDIMEWLHALALERQVSFKGSVNALATRLSKIENMNSKVKGVYQALITDAFTLYMRHEYQLVKLQRVDPYSPASHVVKEEIEVKTKYPATDGNQPVLSEYSENVIKEETAKDPAMNVSQPVCLNTPD
ncbi:uncharacterized protein LOC112574886 isoform X2 [Pomacea canaliculata]|uniref:uncharacterized protein LOC112574886 isoform X2 n=1 Tax=Pomacea canaliculata TaxID=400727 RepID=UPI000D732DF9|nr:uncharacterized protein LOC112574886 isoform X2 [Pomacea canaliculata]